MSNQSRIELLGSAELDAFFKHHTNQGSKAFTKLGHALLQLMELINSLISNTTPARTGTITVAGSFDAFEGLAWVIRENPTPEHPKGRHVVNGGLVRHSDGTWGIHT